MQIKLFSRVWLIYFLLAFPSFYFVYKYGTTDLGIRDFVDYYKLYKDWDITHVDAPFNMRLLSSFFVHLFYKAGLHYNTTISFEKMSTLDKDVFFCAIFFNFLCITTTCSVIFFTIKKHFSNLLLSFSGGLIYLLGFGTLFYEFMPITDACSILLFAICIHYYLSQSYLIIIPLLLLVFQREYIFLALAVLAVMDFWKYRLKYFLYILLTCGFCFIIYFILRKTVFYTPLYDRQASPAYFLDSIFHLKFPLAPYIKQTLMTMNIFFIYLLLLIYKKIKKLEIDSFGFMKVLLLFVQINVISVAAVFGNNTGRYFYILIPFVIFQLVKETDPLFRNIVKT
ncbi:MAG: hypothetical protein H0W61_08285 [Bacteroidetes bacterium]|nr:hypothetical protein [Bacteroidota bacterium]